MTVGEKIKTLRKQHHLTQTELGEKVGVKKNAVSKWECGRVDDIPKSTIKALSTLFSVPASYLIDDDCASEPASAGITMDDFTYAMYQEGQKLTEENKQKLIEMAAFFRQQQEKGN